MNDEYHLRKWGGKPHSEVFPTPFNEGGDLTIVTMPKLTRLRDLSWDRD
jgi:hypothetical protein